MGNEWHVGEEIPNGVRLYDGAGAEVTTGTAAIRYVVLDGADLKWLQDDLTTISTTPNTIAVAHTTGEGFVHKLTVPSGMNGFAGYFAIADPATGRDVYSEEFTVVGSLEVNIV